MPDNWFRDRFGKDRPQHGGVNPSALEEKDESTAKQIYVTETSRQKVLRSFTKVSQPMDPPPFLQNRFAGHPNFTAL